MAAISPVLITQLLELGQAAAKAVQDLRETAPTEPRLAAVRETNAMRAKTAEPEDVLAAIKLETERVLRSEIAARQRLQHKRDRASNAELAATRDADTLVRAAPTIEEGAANPQAIAFQARALSARKDVQTLDAELESAKAQVDLVQAFANSLGHAADDMLRTLGALRRGHEQTQRLNAMTALTDRFMELSGMVDELTDRLDAARAEAEAAQLGHVGPGVDTFLARGRLADAEAGNELRRRYNI